MNIVVLDGHTLNPGDNPWDDLSKLGNLLVYERSVAEDVVARAQSADIVVINKVLLDAAILARLPRLRFIAVTATGYNVVDTKAARARGILVANVPEYGTDSVAQFVFALILELSHRVAQHDAAVHAGEWTRSLDFSFWKSPLIELAGLTMGVVGFGRIGKRVAQLADAFGMKILVTSPTPRNAAVPVTWVSIDELFSTADFVSLHCPLTADNAGFVGADLLQRMKPNSFLVNTARGGLIDEAALADALDRGLLAGAALDVVSREPMAADNPLLNVRNCMITPHIAWATLAARRRLMQQTVGNVSAFLAGSPIHLVT